MIELLLVMIESILISFLLIYTAYWLVKACVSVYEIKFLIKDIKELKEKEYEFKTSLKKE